MGKRPIRNSAVEPLSRRREATADVAALVERDVGSDRSMKVGPSRFVSVYIV